MVSQARGFGAGLVISLVLAVCIAGTVPHDRGSDAVDLSIRLNPNTATVSSLTRLPGIGLARASAIVAYRARIQAETGCRRAFNSAEDLQQIKGIGPVTAGEMAIWLDFGDSSQ